MNKTIDMVREFAEVTQQEPDPSLYIDLIREEYDEWDEAPMRTEHELKELADLVYVCYGYANAIGYDLDEAIRRTHLNNLSRVVQDDGKVLFRADGKVLKNPNHEKVVLDDLV